MKLSEAGRIGSVGMKQCRGRFAKTVGDYYTTDIIECCFLGAAAIGAGIDHKHQIIERYLHQCFPELNTKLMLRITEMNDKLGYNFDQIADILESEGL